MQNRHSQGFTIIEIVVAMAIVAILCAAILPSSLSMTKLNRLEKDVAGSMDYLIVAATNFYIEGPDNGIQRWPNSIAELKSYGYIPSSWSETNPWGNPYTFSSTPYLFTVSTIVPSDIGNGVKARLKMSNIETSGGNSTVSTAVPKPWIDKI